MKDAQQSGRSDEVDLYKHSSAPWSPPMWGQSDPLVIWEPPALKNQLNMQMVWRPSKDCPSYFPEMSKAGSWFEFGVSNLLDL